MGPSGGDLPDVTRWRGLAVARRMGPSTGDGGIPRGQRRLPLLSKSRFLAAEQCLLRLWYECHARELAAPVDAETQATFDAGHAVGKLATTRYPGGERIDEDHAHFAEALQHTARAMTSGAPALFEAAFLHEGVRVRTDVLLRSPDDRWDVLEVKSTSKPKPGHLEDLALQVWVARGAGLDVRRAGLLTLNNRYVHPGGAHDVRTLFRLHDRTEEVQALESASGARVAELHAMLRGDAAPVRAVGLHCRDPHDCAFLRHCSRNVAPASLPITSLPGLSKDKKLALEQQGIVELRQLPADFRLNELQQRVRRAMLSGRAFVSPGLGRELGRVTYPVHHLDFEAFAGPLPRYAGTSPFQAIPFQWSNHIEHADGRLEHHEYLCREDGDPREELTTGLLASLGRAGSICVYSGYETRVMRELSRALPRHRAALRALLPRVWDLLPVVREHYYHPAFHGSLSIKSVLPALVPGLSYDDLALRGGREAAVAYERGLESVDDEARRAIQRDLLEYCARDTLALVELRRALSAEHERTLGG